MNTNRLIETTIPEHIRKSNMVNYITSFFETFELSENDIANLESGSFINTAFGSDLNKFGNLFNLTRTSNESDLEFKSRIKSYFSSFTNGGTINGMKNVIALSLNISIDDIDIIEQTKYNNVFVLDYMFASNWSVNDGSIIDNTTEYYENNTKNSLKCTCNSGNFEIEKTFSSLDLTNYYIFNYLGFWVYVHDNDTFNNVEIIIEDSNGDIISYDTGELLSGQHNINLKLYDKTDDSSFLWDDIVKITISGESTSTEKISIDFLRLNSLNATYKFNVNFEVDEETEYSLFDNVENIIDDVRMNGTEMQQLSFNSKNNIFRYNLSGTNSNDTLL